MAVSGRKVSDLQGSFSRGSAEDFEHCCDSCLTEGQQVEAHGYCLNCQEYLCNNCVRYHKKTSATRDHQLLDEDNMDKHAILTKPADVCTEKCSIHKGEVIKYFCPKHEEIGCNDCIMMNHRTCNLDYIPDKCADIGESEEYRKVVQELEQKLKKVNDVLEKAAVKDKEIDESHDRVVKDIVKLRKEINDHLDTIQRKIEAEASKKKVASKQEVKEVVTSCTHLTSSIKKLQSSLQNSKASNQNGQLFIDIKRTKSELKSVEIQKAEMSLEKTKTKVTFSRNKDLENVLSVQSFGKLTDQHVAMDTPSKTSQALASMPTSKGTLNSLQHRSDIKLDKVCFISGCFVLSSKKLVLADYINSRLMVVNTEKNVVVEKKVLNSKPWDIAELPQDQIAVTIPGMQQVLIMTTAGKLSADRSIKAKGECRVIIYHQNCLYVLCRDPCSIHVLDMKGNIKNTISLADQSVFSAPWHIVMSQDHSLLHVSNYGNHSIVSVTLQGEVSAVYKHNDLVKPMGMLVLDDRSLLVCCYNNHTIHHVSTDLKQGRKVLDGLWYPRSICYSADRSKVYIGGEDDKIWVRSVTYKK